MSYEILQNASAFVALLVFMFYSFKYLTDFISVQRKALDRASEDFRKISEKNIEKDMKFAEVISLNTEVLGSVQSFLDKKQYE